MNKIQSMPREQRRAAAKYLAEQSRRYPAHLVSLPREEWPPGRYSDLIEAWRSRDYLVQVFQEEAANVLVRLSVNCTSLTKDGGWQQNIPWEDMQRLKHEAGYGMFDAVEVYPCDLDVVNVANMSHLWVMREQLNFSWRSHEH